MYSVIIFTFCLILNACSLEGSSAGSGGFRFLRGKSKPVSSSASHGYKSKNKHDKSMNTRFSHVHLKSPKNHDRHNAHNRHDKYDRNNHYKHDRNNHDEHDRNNQLKVELAINDRHSDSDSSHPSTPTNYHNTDENYIAHRARMDRIHADRSENIARANAAHKLGLALAEADYQRDNVKLLSKISDAVDN